MASFSTAQCNSATDNVATLIADGIAALPASADITQVNTDMNTEITRIQAYTDQLAQAVLETAYNKDQRLTAVGNLKVGRYYSYINTLIYATLLQNGPAYIFDGLDFVCSQVSSNAGLSAFLVANTLVVDQYFADAFNQWVLNVASGNYVREFGSAAPAAIASGQVFPHANVDDVNHFTTTGASTGTLAAGAGSLVTKTGGNTTPGGGIIEAYAGNTIGANSYTITVTYTTNLGVTGQTITVSVVGAATANTVFTPSASVNASAITGVAITSGTSSGAGDITKFRLKPARSVGA